MGVPAIRILRRQDSPRLPKQTNNFVLISGPGTGRLGYLRLALRCMWFVVIGVK